MDALLIFELAVKGEYYVFATAFALAVCLLALSAARFILTAVVRHTFPELPSAFLRIVTAALKSQCGAVGEDLSSCASGLKSSARGCHLTT